MRDEAGICGGQVKDEKGVGTCLAVMLHGYE